LAHLNSSAKWREQLTGLKGLIDAILGSATPGIATVLAADPHQADHLWNDAT